MTQESKSLHSIKVMNNELIPKNMKDSSNTLSNFSENIIPTKLGSFTERTF